MSKLAVLAFSGGLDTSFCVFYLKEQGYDVATVTVNTGGFSPAELARIEAASPKLGAISHTTVDARAGLFDGYLRYLVYGNVLRGQMYPLSVSAERVCQARAVAELAKDMGATAIAHGSTGAGNDQVRFDVAFRALAPDLEILTPIRDLNLSRAEEMDYCAQRGLVFPEKTKDYSINEGMWGTSVGGRETLDPWSSLPEAAFPGEGVEEVALVQEAAVEVAQGLFPEQLLARQDQLLQLPVGADEQVRGGGLVAHSALDAEDGVPQVHAPADAVGAAQVVEAGDEGHGVQALAVQRHGGALVEADDQGGGGGGPDDAAGEGGFRQGAPGVQGLPAADAGAPHALVDGVVLGLLGEHQAALGAVVHLLGPGQAQVADGGQDLQVRGQGAEGHVEAHLVVAGAGGAVGDGGGTHALGQFCDRAGLADALGGH